MPTEHDHPLEPLYHARQDTYAAGSALVRQLRPPDDDAAAYATAITSILDGLYLTVDTLVLQCSIWHRVVIAPAGYARLLRMHTALRIMLRNLHDPGCA